MAKQSIKVPTKKKTQMRPPVVRVPDAPENLYLTKDEFVKKRKAMREATLKAEEAYRKEMNAQLGENNIALTEAENDMRKKRQLVVTLRKKLSTIEEELKEAPDTEKKPLKMQIGKITKKIEAATLSQEEAEEEYEKVKAQV